MSTQNHSTRLIPAMQVSEGAGVTVNRTIGTPALRNVDPFMLLDHFNTDSPDDYIAGFPSHPHRGFSTFTYMIDGHMAHQDSMGNKGDLGPGAAQLMKAASGVIHSEMPRQENGLMRGFQLWINLPAAHKMDKPEYQEYPSDAFPVVEQVGYSVKLLMGHFAHKSAPIIDDINNMSYFDVQLKAQQVFQHELAAGNNSLIYVFEGNGQLNGQVVPEHTLIVLGASEQSPEFIAAENGARFVLISGKPINEPSVQYGPFVMNTEQEIQQAMRDFQENNFVKERAWKR